MISSHLFKRREITATLGGMDGVGQLFELKIALQLTHVAPRATACRLVRAATGRRRIRERVLRR